MMADRVSGPNGKYHEPSEELGFQNFAISLIGRATAFARHL
jgi:hypothetical protein